MEKKYIIAAVITALLWGGFMFYRHNKKTDDGSVHREKQNAKITEMAKKSPRAGLAHIGQALQAYHEANGTYPPNLMALYPDYLDNRPLLTQIDWYYKPKGNDFYLTKTVVIGNKRMVASMDSSMRPKSEKRVMVAAPTPPPRPEKKKAETQREGISLSDKERIAMARENFLNALREGRFSVTSVSVPDRDEEQLLAKVMPRFSVTGSDKIATGLDDGLGQRFLVWKGDSNTLGFSNTQYPETRELSIFTHGRWYHVKVPALEALPSKTEAARESQKGHWSEFVLASLDERTIAWKDEGGTYGFGDSQYPESRRLAVFSEGGWTPIEMPTPPRGMVAPQDTGKKPERPKTHMASDLAKQWLVWKTKNGTIGFGNLQYPETHVASVYQEDVWIPLEQAPRHGDGQFEQTGQREKKTQEEIASLFGHRYLVWKDKDGTIGFGNLQYPDSGLSSVYQAEEWVDLNKHMGKGKTEPSVDKKIPERRLLSRNDTVLNGPFLVWKTEMGTLGFGNLQYPDRKGVSHIHVDGGWERFAN